MIRMLKAPQAGKEVIDAAQHFRCPACEEKRKEEEPRAVAPTKPCDKLKFNQEISINVFEVHDSEGARHHPEYGQVPIASDYSLHG